MNTLALIQALVFLQTRTMANNIRVRVRRLRQPKYLLSGIVGLGYFYLIWGRHLFSFGQSTQTVPTLSPELRVVILYIATVVVATLAMLSWIFTSGRAAVAFTETELAFLLPAPLSRRLLLRYKMVKSTLLTLFSAVIFSVISGRFVRDGHAFFHVIGWWLALVIMNLHGMAASFTVQRLTERGLANWKRRLAAIVIIALFIGGVVWWVGTVPPPSLKHHPSTVAKTSSAVTDDLAAVIPLQEWLNHAVGEGPAYWALLPARIAIKPWFATNWVEFAGSALSALGVIGLLGLWVESSDIAFEEASLNRAKKQAELVAQVRSGKGVRAIKRKRVKPLWELRPQGHAVAAFLWKNLIQTGFTRRFTQILSGVAVALIIAARIELPEWARWAIWFMAVGLGGIVLLVGGSFCGQTLSRELEMMDVFKLYPLPGWQIVAGQLAGGIALMTLFVWTSLVVALVFLPDQLELAQMRSMPLLALAFSLALLVPPLGFVNALIPAAAAIYFPAWVRAPKEAQVGFEVTGQRLLMMLGVILVVFFALAPSAVVGGAIAGFGSRFGYPTESIFVGGILAAGILTVEAAVGVWFLGRLFERYDSSSE